MCMNGETIQKKLFSIQPITEYMQVLFNLETTYNKKGGWTPQLESTRSRKTAATYSPTR